jgi:hypothetical protein
MLYWLCTLVFISFCAILGWRFFENTNAGYTDLPWKFNHYQSIDSSELIKSGKVSMALLLQSKVDIQSYLTPENLLVTYSVPTETENLFYKISKEGNVIDSLVIDSRPADIAFIKGFIINKETHQYYKWSINGNKQAIDMPEQNERLDWDPKRQQQQLAEVLKVSPDVYVDYQYEEPEPQKPAGNDLQTIPAIRTYAVLTYFVKSDCFQFFTTLDVHEQFPYTYTEKLLLNNLFKRINTQVSGDKETVKTPNVKYRYFQKLKLEKVQFSGGGGNAPGFEKSLYHGNLFTDVAYKNDTLKLKEFMYLDENWHTSAIQINGKKLGTLTKNKQQPPAIIEAYMYYTNPQLQYALFSNNDKKLYLIK